MTHIYRRVRINSYSDRYGVHYYAELPDASLRAKSLPEMKRKIDMYYSRENPLRSGQYAMIGLGVVTAGLLGYALWSKFGVQALANANQAAFSSSSSGNSPQELAAYQGYAAGVQASQQPGQ